MKIGGLQKLTLLDFPNHLACTVFLEGCNLRCPFCHNSDLVKTEVGKNEGLEQPEITKEELMSFLESRKGLLDGVCITGGEPTLNKDLPDLIKEIKNLGFKVKLDTNGTNPDMLKALMPILDYVAMDIKNSPEKYAQTCGGIDALTDAKKSAEILKSGKVPYEFRTTVCYPLHTPEDMTAIGQWLRGANKYFLQQFVDSGNILGRGVRALTPDEVEKLKDAVTPYIPNTEIRGL